VAVVRGLLLRSVDRALGAVDVERHASAGRSGRGVLNQVRVQAGQAPVVLFLCQDIRLEPMQRGRERDARLPSFPQGEHPKRWVLGQSLGVVGILVTCQAAIDRLTKQIRQEELVIASGARISEMSFDQRVQAEALVQLTRQQQPGVGGHRCAVELDAKLGIEREANWARFRVTHWVVPSAPARSPREPHFLRVGRDYGLIRSPFKTKMRAKSSSAITTLEGMAGLPARKISGVKSVARAGKP
jgi:hypothetical protein